MNLKTFADQNDPHKNPFTEHISDEQFAHMISEGFERGKLDCYADLDGDICFKKYCNNSITVYITENGIAVDYDLDCGGNISNRTWWFDEGIYEAEALSYIHGFTIEIRNKVAYSFEEAWNEMIDAVR